MGNNTSSTGNTSNDSSKIFPIQDVNNNSHSSSKNTQHYNHSNHNYNQSTYNYNEDTYQVPDNNTDITNHINSIHNNRMMDRQFNLPNVPFEPHSFNRINNLPENHRVMNNNNQLSSQYNQNQSQEEQYRQQEQYNNLSQEQHYRQQQQYNQKPHFSKDNDSDANLTQKSLKIFQLESNFTENQLKNSYRSLVLKYHPDRGGDLLKFQYITKCYDYLTELLKLKRQDAQFYELKNQSNNFIEKQATYQNVNMDKDNFNTEKFNQIFSENRIETEESKGGYGEWIKENAYSSTDINKNSRLTGNFSNNKFNQEFVKNSSRDKMEIVEYTDPIPTPIKQNISYSEIDDTQKEDYSSNTSADNICYTDYRKAHTKTHLIDSSVVNRKEFKNVKQLEKSRSEIQYQMSPEDMRKQAANEEILQYQENERLKRIKNKDQQTSEHFNKVNQLMLQQNFIE